MAGQRSYSADGRLRTENPGFARKPGPADAPELPRIDRERLTVAETVAPQGRNFLAIQVNQPTLRCLYGRQPQTVHADPFEGRILPGILHQLLQQGYHVGVLIDRHMVSFCGGKQQLVDDRREQTAKQRTLWP